MIAIKVPTMRGEIELVDATTAAIRCSLGCGRKGGGMLIAKVTGATDEPAQLGVCGDCLARALVAQIDRNTAGAGHAPAGARPTSQEDR